MTKNRTISTIVVDDERLARKRLIRLLSAHSEITIVAEASTVDEAVLAIEVHAPDLIFLDIQMPGGDGFTLFDRCEIHANVVFVTAYDTHALRAFDVNAIDYLMKPISPSRLGRSIERIGQAPASVLPLQIEIDDRIHVTTARGTRFISVSDVVAIRSAGDYTELHLRDGTSPMSRCTLGAWEERLSGRDFVRIHRTAIIRISLVECLERKGGGSIVRLRPLGIEVPVSRRALFNLEAALCQRLMP